MAERMLLSGIKVLDVGSYLAGPAGGTVMADFGADVIKIEPRGGDPYRQLGEPAGMPKPVHNPFWVQDARSKRSLAVDLKDPRVHAALLRMVEQCDVFLTNYRPQLLERLRLRWEDLRGVNPSSEVLREFGLSSAQIDELVQAGVVYCAAPDAP